MKVKQTGRKFHGTIPAAIIPEVLLGSRVATVGKLKR